jgi:hypothetical protein
MQQPALPTSTAIERKLMVITLLILTAAVVWHFWR